MAKEKSQPKAPKTKRFGGKTYERWMYSKTKRRADKIAKDNREAGTPARVTKIEGKYVVYLRK